MKTLTRDAFGRARDFLKTQARPLDRAMFEYRFEGAGTEHALTELARFQNEDGGFGHALEPDLRTPTSSALATGIGLSLLKELHCPAEHPLVRGAVGYLLDTFNAEAAVWRVAPLDTNQFPHAPWWHDEDGSLARTFDHFRIIPRAQIVGLLHHYSELVSLEWLDELTEHTVRYIETVEPLGTGGGDDLSYALSLAETDDLPQPFKGRLVKRVRAVTPQVISRDPQEWETYTIMPLKLVSSPASLVTDLIWDEVQAHLDYQIDHQTPEGTWDPVWTWSEFYPAVWEDARREWRGHLTLGTLMVLRAFGRMET
ncbi:MAG: hypothetical protein M3220_15800 [Chloroflexota bacterium]|nr:hypothetical protein [Chloroflexota bacterium]